MNHDFKYDFTTILDRRGKDARSRSMRRPRPLIWQD